MSKFDQRAKIFITIMTIIIFSGLFSYSETYAFSRDSDEFGSFIGTFSTGVATNFGGKYFRDYNFANPTVQIGFLYNIWPLFGYDHDRLLGFGLSYRNSWLSSSEKESITVRHICFDAVLGLTDRSDNGSNFYYQLALGGLKITGDTVEESDLIIRMGFGYLFKPSFLSDKFSLNVSMLGDMTPGNNDYSTNGFLMLFDIGIMYEF